VELIPESATVFAARQVGARVEFVLAKRGPADKMLLLGPGGQRVAKRTSLDWPSGDRLAALIGSYTSNELGVTYRVEQGEVGLVLVHPKGSSPLLPVLPDRYETDLGTIRFERKHGRATAFRLDTPRSLRVKFERSD
jgi:hypothetical protein